MVHDPPVTEPADRLEQTYREQRHRLWRSLVGYTSDPDVASDAMAEAFAQALARGAAIVEVDGWVWRAAFRIASGELARRRRESKTESEPAYHLPESVDHIVSALARISPNQRLAVVLHDYADRPTDEIASIMGASRATVHVHLSQGRRRLRKLLEDDDV